MKSIFKILLTTFDKEFNRKMIIRNLKPLISRKKPAVLANYQISKKISKYVAQSKKVKNCKSWVIFFFHIWEIAAKIFIYEIPMEDPTWYYDWNLLSRGYTQICSLVSGTYIDATCFVPSGTWRSTLILFIVSPCAL